MGDRFVGIGVKGVLKSVCKDANVVVVVERKNEGILGKGRTAHAESYI